MSSTRNKWKGWPRPRQVLMLKAAFGDDQVAAEAWRAWRPQVDLEKLHPTSNYLQSPLFPRLSIFDEVDTETRARLKGTYSYVWAKTQAMVYAVTPAITAMQAVDIDVMLIKGIELAHTYYRDLGARRMNVIDLLVPEDKARQAIGILREHGWTPRSPFVEALVPIRHGAQFFNEDGLSLELNWHLMLECCYEGADGDFWNGAVTREIEGLSVKALNPSDLLFLVCVYGPSSYFSPAVRWAADAWMLIQHAGDQIDWERVIGQARKRDLVVQLRQALSWLHDVLDVDVPDDVLTRLHSLPVTRFEQVEHWCKLRCQQYLGVIPMFWFSYLRLKRHRSGSRRRGGFYRYLQQNLSAPCLRQLPVSLARAARTRYRRLRHW